MKKYLYYLLLSCILCWCLLIIAAPILGHFHHTISAGLIYLFFSKICHQSAERSFFIYDKQFAVCIRCTCIYAGFLLGTVIHPFLKIYITNLLRLKHVVLLSLFLLGLDALLPFWGIWQSNLLTRAFTGLASGTTMALFIIPGFFRLVEKNGGFS